MPRPKKANAPEPKRRSRNGCWPCKSRKVKCGEEKPRCLNCERQGEACDYSIRLNWGGRSKNKDEDKLTQVPGVGVITGFQQAQFITTAPKQRKTSVSSADSQHALPSNQQVGYGPPLSGPMQAMGSAGVIDPHLVNICENHGGGRILPNEAPTSDPQSRLPFPNTTSISGGVLPIAPDGRTNGQLSRSSSDYPSPSTPATEGTIMTDTAGSNQPVPGNGPMLPPLRGAPSNATPTHVFKGNGDIGLSAEHRSKRMKMSTGNDVFPQHQGPSSTKYEAESSASVLSSDMQSPGQSMLTPYSPYGSLVGTPLTPGSSTASDDNGLKLGSRNNSYQGPPDFRRLSVNSLLSGPPGTGDNLVNLNNLTSQGPFTDDPDGFTTYGFDEGHPDMDIPHNDDKSALGLRSPTTSSRSRSFPSLHSNDEEAGTTESSNPPPKQVAFARRGYYAQPVPIRIPRSLEPLPPQLVDNQMNLLYFYHFLNHTARILVPHDCQANPFRNILPPMAIKNPNLLNLLLAYSASHRARLLGHREPTTRIAFWVQDVFKNLRHGLDDHSEEAINANLATAIMLASLEIMSPNCFDVHITWLVHLGIARSLILARGGPRHIHRKDTETFFLSRWYAYIDITGALSGRKNNIPLEAKTWSYDYELPGDDQQIDCLMGFTFRVMGLLAHVAELSRKCDNDRIDENGEIKSDWIPSFEIVAAAEKLERELNKGRECVISECKHGAPPLPLRATNLEVEVRDERDPEQDSLEAQATNEAFHLCGLIHLYRRVLGRPRADPVVQAGVSGIVSALYKVRRGSSAEASLLLPTFSAGCDALDEDHRHKILERVRSVEGFGMTHWHRARKIMQQSWETGRPWFTLVDGEYFG
ncbi:hypothetical protein EV356DRAFT_523944 [Viridothelium virens]|uniref:Zn(2)-C6 fungal-type domain-containing protein n=1 Tax=Viridothelium virens TaxID=1048519 RepID=A0A6A6HPA7_VIRVR|nr:hypothetical protein EV356DRAFT_523944 [Viridothelium virens]